MGIEYFFFFWLPPLHIQIRMMGLNIYGALSDVEVLQKTLVTINLKQ